MFANQHLLSPGLEFMYVIVFCIAIPGMLLDKGYFFRNFFTSQTKHINIQTFVLNTNFVVVENEVNIMLTVFEIPSLNSRKVTN